MADQHAENDRNPGGNPSPSPRRRYIQRAAAGYAVLGTLWIIHSNTLITSRIDATTIYWLSVAQGLLFVVVTTLLLVVALRGVPGAAVSQPVVPRLESMLAAATGKRILLYGFAVLVTLAMVWVRYGIAGAFGEQPLLILFMFPIILSAMAGGLGPGLVATLIAALGAAHSLPPVNVFLIAASHELFQWNFLIVNGALVSILSETLHRQWRHSEANLQLQAVTLASIGEGMITTDNQGKITYLNPEAEKMTGWTNAEAMGRPMASISRVVGEQSRQPLADSVKKVLASGEAVEVANHALLLTRDGRELPVQDSCAPIRLANGVMVGVVLVFRDVGARIVAENALRQSLAEKVALLKEVHHRVKNNLQIVASLLNLQADRTANPEAVAALSDTRNRIRSMALLHEVLYRSENLALINLAAYVRELSDQLVRVFGHVPALVQVERRIAAISLPLEQAVPCGLIINELVTNALKYGFPDGKTGRVLVEVDLNDGRVELAVSDSGVGLPPGFDPAASSSLGLQLVRNLAVQLGGSLEWERGTAGGAFFRVRFPAPAKTAPATTAKGETP